MPVLLVAPNYGCPCVFFGPDDELKLQFEALRQFDEDERKTAQEVLDGLILKHQAKRMVQRTQSQNAIKQAAKAAQAGG